MDFKNSRLIFTTPIHIVWVNMSNFLTKKRTSSKSFIALLVIGLIGLFAVVILLGANTARIGQTVSRDGLEFTTQSFKCGYITIGKGAGTGPELFQGDSEDSKDAQGQFCLLELSIRNTGSKPKSLKVSNQHLYDDQGRQFLIDTTATRLENCVAPVNSEGLFPGSNTNDDCNDDETPFIESNINPGNSISGRLVFDVPQNANIVEAKLHNPSILNRVKVKLQ